MDGMGGNMTMYFGVVLAPVHSFSGLVSLLTHSAQDIAGKVVHQNLHLFYRHVTLYLHTCTCIPYAGQYGGMPQF